jgi:hypothetical protein
MMFLMLCLTSTVALAQAPPEIVLLPSATSVQLGWDKPTTGDPVTGYEVVFANTAQTGEGVSGQVLKTIAINDPNAVSLEVTVSEMPSVKNFYASLRAISGTLKSVHSNSLLFRRATPPGAPGNFRGVVAEAQASSGKPGSGDVTDDSLIRMWEGSTHVIEPLASSLRSSSLTVGAEHGLSLSNQALPGKSASLTSSPSPK